MNAHNRRLVDEVLSLPAREKAEVVDKLLDSLDQSDKQLDMEWRKEVDDRLKGYRKGSVEAVPLSEVLAKYRK
ncbi:addiction module protein [Microbulbifer halophilus]|uniref:Addiction module protein n=1 Tax=Microbulbifer halophilus TaxID=453963 RepID=A0ABW5ECC0_9GAMM|nr:addiction module protein [Microbulbifer halophilus]MCW8125125.1 addiction module protein [Microbulbifer halophilus]